MKKYYHGRSLTPEEVKEWFAYTLFPAGEKGDKPVTLSQPFVWMINSKAGQQNPKYDELKDIYHELAFLVIVKASDLDINAIHSIISAHLPDCVARPPRFSGCSSNSRSLPSV